MDEEEWLSCTSINSMLSFLRGKASDRKMRLFAVACCRRVWVGLRDPRSRNAVEVAERFADGNASEEELRLAHDAAYHAVDDCLNYSPFSEDQAIAAYLTAATLIGEPREPHDPHQGDLVLLSMGYAIDGLLRECEAEQAILLRDIFNPFRPVTIDPRWLTSRVVDLARTIYEGFSRQAGGYMGMAILADALMDAGCDSEEMLNHCRSEGPHVRGCWAVDLILGKS